MMSNVLLNKIIEWSLLTHEPPAYKVIDKVKVTGEALAEPVHWQGRQWAVTAYGIEARNGTYAFAGDRVWEECNNDGWIHHMARKDWVDLPDFAEALRLARDRWPKP